MRTEDRFQSVRILPQSWNRIEPRFGSGSNRFSVTVQFILTCHPGAAVRPLGQAFRQNGGHRLPQQQTRMRFGRSNPSSGQPTVRDETVVTVSPKNR